MSHKRLHSPAQRAHTCVSGKCYSKYPDVDILYISSMLESNNFYTYQPLRFVDTKQATTVWMDANCDKAFLHHTDKGRQMLLPAV